MGRYAMIKREFDFLTRLYGFKIGLSQKYGAYYYIEWINSNICIMVLYDERIENPVIIRIYDADSLGTIYDAIEYQNEFSLKSGSPHEKIHYASEWLKKSIADKVIGI